MIIEQWTGPPVETHTYVLVDEPTRTAWVIDAPLDTATKVLAHLRDHDLKAERLILTHGHFDHILDTEQYVRAGLPVSISPKEQALLSAPQTQMFGVPYPMPSFEPDEELGEGDMLQLGDNSWVVWDVPGHSPGHLLLYNAACDLIVGGDLLFRSGYGRVDLPGSDPGQMAASLRRLLTLPDQTRVLPGHGPETTVGAERPWLQELLADPNALRL